MKKTVNWLISNQNITVNYDGQTHIVARGDELSDRLIDAIKGNKLDEIPAMVDAAVRVKQFSKGSFEVRDGEIFVKGQKVSSYLGDKILKFANQGLPHEPLVKFAEKLNQNPSHRAVNELFEFLEKNDHPITEEGNFIAYKKVRDDFFDVHSGTILNSVGSVISMPRNAVDEDKNRTCSTGLHCSSWNYASQFYHGATMLELEVNPAHVVAVPTDYNQEKMRVCEYKVLNQVDCAHSSGTQLKQTSSGYAPLASEDVDLSGLNNSRDEEWDDEDEDADEWEEDDSWNSNSRW